MSLFHLPIDRLEEEEEEEEEEGEVEVVVEEEEVEEEEEEEEEVSTNAQHQAENRGRITVASLCVFSSIWPESWSWQNQTPPADAVNL